MRELKFRAWNKKSKQMTERSFSFNGFDGDCFYDYYARPTDSDLWYLEDMEIMQFTGLKDANGREIYEGDIIKVSEDYSHEVAWNKDTSSFCIKYFDDGKEKLSDHLSGAEISEVIGNIYENPEILK